MIRWDDVRYFLAIHRCGTLSGAARSLAVDQTTVGRRLGALEDALNARLFDRTPDGFLLTSAGESILAAAEKVEASVLELEHQVSGEDARTAGNVRIATSEAFAVTFLLERISELRRRYDGIHVEVFVGQSMVDLTRREADIALRIRPRGLAPAQPHLIARKLSDIAFALYGGRGYIERHGRPPRPDDLRGHRLIGWSSDVAAIPGVEWLLQAGQDGEVVARCSSILSLIRAAQAEIGLAVLPCYAAETYPELERLSDPIDWSELWLVVHPDVRRAARVRAVMDFLIETVERSAPVLRGEAGIKA
ncbi:MAG TPA: LysR family transcriptional regulator [Polyangiaceae bacterium]|jgi:DNA-binding transcriptional LysR family regulator|nr:LysR family transcriptional regulator [Polyangiaceae bacterium]